MDRLSTRLYSATAFILVALFAISSAAMLTLNANAADTAAPIQFERVVIEGHSAAPTAKVEQLPRVIIVGQRQNTADVA
jgi:hypothetical protein